MLRTQQLSSDVTLIGGPNVLPGVGLLNINCFVLAANEPMLVETGPANRRDEFLDAIWAVVDPSELRWIWITHTDLDHVGNLAAVLEAAPNAQVVTNYTGLLKMSTFAPIPTDRVRLVHHDETLSLGDRTVRAWRPPLYDAPETTGLFDESSGVLFSSDCFGGILSEDVASADELTDAELTLAAQRWTAIDAPWVSKLDRSMFQAELDDVQKMDPTMILSGHMPPIQGSIQALLEAVSGAPEAPAFDSIDHDTLMAMITRPEV